MPLRPEVQKPTVPSEGEDRAPPSRRERWRAARHRVHAAALSGVFGLLRAVPLDMAAALGGWVGRAIGPLLPANRVGRANLAHAFPGMPQPERERVLRDMWRNLGRGVAEFAHLDRIYPAGRVDIVGGEHFDRLREDGVGGVIFSCHCANWELLSPSLTQYGIAPTLLYRPSRNARADRLFQAQREAAHAATGSHYFQTTPRGFRQAVRNLKNGGHIAMLVDLKAKADGIEVELFGRPALVPTGAAQLALAYDVPIVPARLERLGGESRFRLTAFPPIDFERTGNGRRDAERLTRLMLGLVEEWMRERPEQWLWIYRRWKET